MWSEKYHLETLRQLRLGGELLSFWSAHYCGRQEMPIQCQTANDMARGGVLVGLWEEGKFFLWIRLGQVGRCRMKFFRLPTDALWRQSSLLTWKYFLEISIFFMWRVNCPVSIHTCCLGSGCTFASLQFSDLQSCFRWSLKRTVTIWECLHLLGYCAAVHPAATAEASLTVVDAVAAHIMGSSWSFQFDVTITRLKKSKHAPCSFTSISLIC